MWREVGASVPSAKRFIAVPALNIAGAKKLSRHDRACRHPSGTPQGARMFGRGGGGALVACIVVCVASLTSGVDLALVRI
jgi:hypothetical protein